MIKFFIDTGNVDEIREACSWGMISGATINPSLAQKEIARQGNKRAYDEVVKEICDIVKGPVSLQVTRREAGEMTEQARKLANIASNVVVKIPLNLEGLKAMKAITGEKIRVNATLCYTLNQALLAAVNGASYVSPFVGRMDKISYNGTQIVKDIREAFKIYDIKTEIIFAAVRHPLHVVEAAKAGADIVTLQYSVLQDMTRHPLTDSGLDSFLADWEKVPGELRGVLK